MGFRNPITTAEDPVARQALTDVGIAGNTITGATFRTAAAGQRVQIDSADGLRGIDATETVRTRVGTDGRLYAEQATISGTLTAGGSSGQRVVITETGGVDGGAVVEVHPSSGASGPGTLEAGSDTAGATANLASPPNAGGLRSSLTLRGVDVGDEGAWLSSSAAVYVAPAAGHRVNVLAPLRADGLDNFRFYPAALVMTDASGYAQYNFPEPFGECWFVEAATTGEFGYSFIWTVVSWTATGVLLRAGKPDGSLIVNASLVVKIMAVGR